MKRRSPQLRPIAMRELSRDGVDRSLFHWMLSLTPRQRLQALEEHLRAVSVLRRESRGK